MNWQNIGAAVAVIIAVGSVLFTVNERMVRLEERSSTLEEWVRDVDNASEERWQQTQERIDRKDQVTHTRIERVAEELVDLLKKHNHLKGRFEQQGVGECR